jgi:hypothetical protein
MADLGFEKKKITPCISRDGLERAPDGLRLLLKENMRSTSDTGRLIAEVGNLLRDRGTSITLHELERECLARPAAFRFTSAWDLDSISRGQLAICWRNGVRVGGASLMREALGRKELTPGDLLTLEWFPRGLPATVGDSEGQIMRNTQWRVREVTADGRSALLEHLRDPDIAFWMPVRIEVKAQHVAEAGKLAPHAPPPVQLNLQQRRGFWLTWGGYITAHKAQGDECDFVQISLDDLKSYANSAYGRERCSFGFPAWVRWAYTSISRARQQVVFVTGTDSLVPQLPDPVRTDKDPAWL